MSSRRRTAFIIKARGQRERACAKVGGGGGGELRRPVLGEVITIRGDR